MYWKEKQAKKQSNKQQHDAGHSSFMHLKRTKNWFHNVASKFIFLIQNVPFTYY